MNNLPFDDDQQWRSVSRKRKKRSVHGHRNTKIRDSFYAFLETGLVVMTNAVILDHKQSMRVFSERHRQALMQNAIKYTTRCFIILSTGINSTSYSEANIEY